MEDFVRWYSPRDWIAYDDASHDHSCSKDVEDGNDDVQYTAVTNSNTTSDPVDSTGSDVTNNNTATDNVTNFSNATGWDEDWAEVDEQTSFTSNSEASISHRVSLCV